MKKKLGMSYHTAQLLKCIRKSIKLQYNENGVFLNWKNLAFLNVEEIIDSNDLDVLDEHLQVIMNCDAKNEIKTVMSEDFFKVFQLSQLILQYLNKLNKFLITEYENQQHALLQTQKSLKASWKYQQKLSLEIKRLKLKLKKKFEKDYFPTMDFPFPNTTKTGSNISFSPCTECYKVFINKEYLEAHVSRRHGSPELNHNNASYKEVRKVKHNKKIQDNPHENSESDACRSVLSRSPNLRDDCFKELSSELQKKNGEITTLKEKLQTLENSNEVNYKLKLKAQECFWRSKVEELEIKLAEASNIEKTFSAMKDEFEKKCIEELSQLKRLCGVQQEEIEKHKTEIQELKYKIPKATHKLPRLQHRENGDLENDSKESSDSLTMPHPKTIIESEVGQFSEGEYSKSIRLEAGKNSQAKLGQSILTNPHFFDMLKSEVTSEVDSKLQIIGIPKTTERLSKIQYFRSSQILKNERNKVAEKVRDFHAIRLGLNKFIEKKMVLQQEMLSKNYKPPKKLNSLINQQKTVTFDEPILLNKLKDTCENSHDDWESLHIREGVCSGIFSNSGLCKEIVKKHEVATVSNIVEGSTPQLNKCSSSSAVVKVEECTGNVVKFIDDADNYVHNISGDSNSDSNPPELPDRPPVMLLEAKVSQLQSNAKEQSQQSSNWDSDSDKDVKKISKDDSISLSDLDNELEQIEI